MEFEDTGLVSPLRQPIFFNGHSRLHPGVRLNGSWPLEVTPARFLTSKCSLLYPSPFSQERGFF